MYKVSVIGATGYVGAEITRLLSGHPSFSLSVLSSRTYTGEAFSDVYPSMRGFVDMPLEEMDLQKICENSDFVVTALPHGVSSKVVPELLKGGARVIDHSGDYRFDSISDYLRTYKTDHHSPEYISEAVYGLPEIYRDRIAKTRLVSNPGCYPTCSILAAAPLLQHQLIKPNGIVINGASGISGAGRSEKTEYSYCETAESFKAYTPVGHRHTPEMEQEFSKLFGEKLRLTFTPHLVPMKRGMLCTIYADLADTAISSSDVASAYSDAYGDEYFVRFLGEEKTPQTKAVSGSNFADVSFFINRETGKIIMLCAIDNLGKGAASQAVQCLNLMAGIEEDAGLLAAPLYI